MKKLLALLITVIMLATCTAFAEGAERTRVTLCVVHPIETIEDCFFWSALYLGFFEEEGLDVELIPQKGTTATQMLLSGECDLALPSTNTICASIEAGMKDLRVVYQGAVKNVFGFVTKADGPIKSWDDFANKSIVSWAAGEPLSNPILLSAGVDPSTIQYVSAYDQRSAMLATDSVDAAFTWQGEWQVWEGTLGVDLTYWNGDDVLKNCSNPWICTKEYYENNKETIAKVGRAIAKGSYFCGANPEAAGAMTMTYMPNVDISVESAGKVAEGVYDLWTPEDGIYGRCDREKWELSIYWLEQYGTCRAENIDLDTLLCSAEFEDTYNDWDRSEIDALAASITVEDILK